jgi:hypothetical protein
LSDSEPIPFRPRPAVRPIHRITATGPAHAQGSSPAPGPQICFNRLELTDILDIYGRMVAAGEWRDYAIDMGREKAVFSVFRRTTEFPLFRIEKAPKLAKKQGAYSVVAANGQILKRGADLKRVLDVLDVKLKPVR